MKEMILNMQIVLRLCVVVMLVAVTSPLVAQNSVGDRLFQEGKNLQRRGDCEKAIKKFESAKKCYDSAAKLQQCDDAISECRKPKSKTGPTPPKGDVIDQPDPVVFISLSKELLKIKEGEHTETIHVSTSEKAWTATPLTNEGEDSFVTVKPHPDKKSFDITGEANNSARRRSQDVKVSAGKKEKKILVEQSGKSVELSVEKTVVVFGINGGIKSIEVYSTSDEKEEGNNYRNWRVLSKPNWANVVGEVRKEKSKLRQKAERLFRKRSLAAEDPTFVTSVMKIVASKKPNGSQPRNGEIIIGSGDQLAKIIVQQD